jgi:anti-sigma28 factor (negative regulator of flagellin synthesis)
MKINNGYSRDVTPRSSRAASDPANVDRPASTGATPDASQSSSRDSVELSAEGIARSKDATLSDQRIAQIRQNVLQGAYDSSHVVDQVAKKILASGDI